MHAGLVLSVDSEEQYAHATRTAGTAPPPDCFDLDTQALSQLISIMHGECFHHQEIGLSWKMTAKADEMSTPIRPYL
jgi:hypothetical protein